MTNVKARMLNHLMYYAKYMYYMATDPILTDSEYDKLEVAMAKILKDNPEYTSGYVPWQHVVVDFGDRGNPKQSIMRLVHWHLDEHRDLMKEIIDEQ
jgi:NAD-dependent DNA ligase